MHLAGHIPTLPNGKLLTGTVGKEKSVEEGKEAARVCAINLMSSIKGST